MDGGMCPMFVFLPVPVPRICPKVFQLGVCTRFKSPVPQ